jgi:HEAT repeats
MFWRQRPRSIRSITFGHTKVSCRQIVPKLLLRFGFALLGAVAVSLAATAPTADSHQSASVPKLFERLQSEETTNQAAEQFMILGPRNDEARRYLTKSLPTLIMMEQKGHPHSWVNAVRLAGEFRITEAIPALAKWIDLPVGSLSGGTLAEAANLDFSPAGKALAKIGEPAVPTLARVLEKGDQREQWVAYRALYLIGSAQSLMALRQHVGHEKDANFRREMQQALEGKHS